MIKSQRQFGPKKTLLQQVQNALPLLLESLPEIRVAMEELELKRQRTQLIAAIRALQVIRRAVTTGTGADRLDFLQLERYLDLIILALRLDIDTQQQETNRVQQMAMEILAAHQLDQPSTDHLLLIHDNLLPALSHYFIRTILKKQFKQTQKIAQFLYDSAYSNYNPKILAFDENCIYILQNILNFQEEDYRGYEYELQQAIRYAVSTLQKISQVEELQLPLQYLYGKLLIQVIQRNILDDQLTLQICDVLRMLYCPENGIFEDDLRDLQDLVVLIENIDSVQVQQYVEHFKSLIRPTLLYTEE